MLKIQETIGSMACNIEFQQKINILKGDSGIGKSWMMHLLKSYFVANEISHYFVNYLSKSEPEFILKKAEECEYLLLDNADLYLDRGTVEQLLQCRATCVVATRFIKIFDAKKMGLYQVVHEEGRLFTQEVAY